MFVKIKDISVSLVFIWLIMFMAFPFSISQAFSLPAKIIMGVGSLILIFMMLMKRNKIQINSSIIFIFIFQIFTAVVYFFLHHDNAYVNLLFQIITPLLIYIYISSYLEVKRVSESMIKLMALMGGLSFICFLLCLLFNLSYFSTFQNPDGRVGYNFIISFTNTLLDFGFTKFIRPAGFFDEPGTLAFYLTVSILLNDLTNNNKLIRIILIVSGVFTFSIAFYLIMLLYSILYIKKEKLGQLLLFSFLAVLISVLFYSNMEKEQQDIVYGSSLGRLESLVNSSSSPDYYQADNRSDLINNAREAIYDSPLIGQGISYASKKGNKFYGSFIGANFLGIFGVHGLIGGLIFSLHVLYYFFICFRKKYWLTVPQKSCLIYLLLILQRPDYVGGILTYVSVLLLILTSIKFHNVSENINNNNSL